MAARGIEYPYIRLNVVAAVYGFSDPEYQKQCWMLGICPDGEEDSLDLCFHIIMDDYSFLQEPDYWVGLAVYNSEEARSIHALCKCLMHLVEKYGNQPDQFLLASPEWVEVVAHAKHALATLADATRKFGV